MDDYRLAYRQPAALLQRLVRFDTTNPPGNEGPCIAYIDSLLGQAGIQTTMLAAKEDRPNLIARLPGQGLAPPLLLYGHVDVVSTEGQEWTHPPFAAEQANGLIWGRGALDMKSGVAMFLAAMLRAADEGWRPAGDLVFVALADEEAAGNCGARFLVEHHPEHFAGIRYALGEVGGHRMHMAGQAFYPLQVGEKQLCWMKATMRGRAGHGSRPVRGGAMASLGQFLVALDRHRLPAHVTPIAEQMVTVMAAALGGDTGRLLSRLLDTGQTDAALETLAKSEPASVVLDPLLHNTVSPTIVRGGNKINVIPGTVSLELDGRLLPGYGPEDMLTELAALLGPDRGQEVAVEVVRHDAGPSEPDMGWFGALGEILSEMDPGAVPLPYMLAGVTDGRFFSRLGIQTYGFTPLDLPADFPAGGLAHAADERVPVEAVDFGCRAVYEAVRRYGY